MGIRNAAKAIIVHDGKILLNKNLNSMGDMCYGLPNGAVYYDLPGGGQNQYETLEEAVIRECLEETGYTASVDRLLAIYEEISTNSNLRIQYKRYAHKIFFVFLCRLTDAPPAPATEKDMDMLQPEWISLRDIKSIPLYPQIIHANLERLLDAPGPVYLGSERIP